jgi:hypothetical protein
VWVISVSFTTPAVLTLLVRLKPDAVEDDRAGGVIGGVDGRCALARLFLYQFPIVGGLAACTQSRVASRSAVLMPKL